jgi:hypothetical protein
LNLLMPFRACAVTFKDSDGVLQTAKVDAETAFEAAALALKFLFEGRQKSFAPLICGLQLRARYVLLDFAQMSTEPAIAMRKNSSAPLRKVR